jgi:DNA-binding NarL/FixJ family response regulator
MPGIEGRRCLKEILASDPQSKVLIASSYATNWVQGKALSEGAAGFLPKPFRAADLLATVKSVLCRK